VLFNVDVQSAPRVIVDQREVIHAAWFTVEEAARENVFPPLAQLIQSRAASNGA
jgi:hypothetical protein